MENKNTGLIVLAVILSVAVLGLGGFIIYDKILSDNTKVDVNENNFQNNEDKSAIDNSKISMTSFYGNSVAIVSNGEVYLNVNCNNALLEEQLKLFYGNEILKTLNKTRQIYKEYTFDNFEYNNSNFMGMKLNTNNVSNVYEYIYGQSMGNDYGLILLNEDKTVSMISLYSLINGNSNVKNISGLSNIEKIITENNDGIYIYAVNGNGEKFNLNDYVPTDYKKF